MQTPLPPSGHDSRAAARTPRSTLVSRNVTISGHRTSIRLEPEMWSGLSEICRREGGSLHDVCTAVAMRKGENTSLTAAIRVFVMAYYRAAATEEGHGKVGHGYGVAALTAGNAGTHPQRGPGAMPASLSPSGSSSTYAGRAPHLINTGNRGGLR